MAIVITLEGLQYIAKRDNALLVGTYEKIGCATRITYNCSCGKTNTKHCQNVFKAGAFCKVCCRRNKIQKIVKH